MKKPPTYTINCDLGEGVPNEALIIPLIDLASVACGGHYGDSATIQATLDLVKANGKKAGAHPSYPDKENFGRKSLDIHPKDLIASLADQIELFCNMAQAENVAIDHIKFHGALYNDAADKTELADLLLDFLAKDFPTVPLFVPPNSQLEQAASSRNHPIRLEIFGDRAYQDDYKLLSRKFENSLFIREAQIVRHLDAIFLRGQINTNSGHLIPVNADTICFHGDNPGILDFLPQVRSRYWS